MNKIKIDVKQAAEFMTLGYEIECHVLIPTVKQTPIKQRTINKVIPADAEIRLSVDNEGPTKGQYLLAWNQLKDKLWTNGNLTETKKRSTIEAMIEHINPKLDAGFFTYLVNNKKCLRVVD